MMKKKALFNKVNKLELKKLLEEESFDRITASFYRYIKIDEPNTFRDHLYDEWHKLKVFGRVYIAKEGINAQISVPDHNWEAFIMQLNRIKELTDMHIKKALQDGPSFYKLIIKVREELVAYGVPKESYDMDHVGKHLSTNEYNKALEDPHAIVCLLYTSPSPRD